MSSIVSHLDAREMARIIVDAIDRAVNRSGGSFEPEYDRSCSTAGTAATHSAIDEAYRAAQDLPG